MRIQKLSGFVAVLAAGVVAVQPRHARGQGGPVVVASLDVPPPTFVTLSFESDSPGVPIVCTQSLAHGSPAARIEPATCVTPCQIVVPSGNYACVAGGHPFSVQATSGVQRWWVDGESDAQKIGAYVLWSLAGLPLVGGLTLLPLGFLLGEEGSRFFVASLGLLGVGAGMTAGAVALWFASYGSAELRFHDPSATTATGDGKMLLGLTPTLGILGVEDGRPVLGLGLNFTFM